MRRDTGRTGGVVVVVVPPLTRGGGISLAFAVSVWRYSSTIKLSAHPRNPNSTDAFPSQSMEKLFRLFLRPLFSRSQHEAGESTTLTASSSHITLSQRPKQQKGLPWGTRGEKRNRGFYRDRSTSSSEKCTSSHVRQAIHAPGEEMLVFSRVVGL